MIFDAIWSKGGEATTARGDKVIWGYFYASPDDVNWGNADNPDLFVKIWFDISGRIDVNYFHVSVPHIRIYTASSSSAFEPDLLGTTNMTRRYVRHIFYPDGYNDSDENYEDGLASPNYLITPDPIGYQLNNGLHIGARIQQVNVGSIVGIWQSGGEAITARGDEVTWGYFSADPSDVSWGDQDNPELFVKIWVDVSGRVDINYFHVSVPQITVYSGDQNNVSFDQRGSTITADRYIRHEYFLE